MNDIDPSLNPLPDKTELTHNPETLRDIQAVVDRVKSLMSEHKRPILVVLDGRSGTGKSTLASKIAAQVGGEEILQDDFWAGGPDEEWDARTPQEKADMAIDWKRLRKEVLEPLLAGKAATWHPFDWEANKGLAEHTITKGPSPAIILDGAYASRPELADIIDLSVLVEVPNDEHRRKRLLGREGEEYMKDWHTRWDVAEDYYFGQVRPKSSFDMTIENH